MNTTNRQYAPISDPQSTDLIARHLIWWSPTLLQGIPAVEAVIDARYVLREQLSEDDVSDMMSELTAPVYHLCCYWVAFLTREAGPYPIIMCPYSDEPDLGDDDDGTDDAH